MHRDFPPQALRRCLTSTVAGAALLLAGAALLLAGCAAQHPVAPPPLVPAEQPAPPPPPLIDLPPPPPEPARPRADGPNALLAYADRVRSMTPQELVPEIARLAEIPDSQRVPFNDLQLVVALGQTHLAADVQRAQPLIQRVLADASEAAHRLHPIARLLAARYAEQRRVEDLLDRQSQQLRDSQRRIDQLNERLEAVRAIERSLTSRGHGGNPPPAQPKP
ncbi:hypothetical protein [Xylophilus sp.]|uniref:hypothetical protein n=1 Tax=Xylophilus sp. TaxID=2653893 RepID=UPI0013B61A62|nr:hypothetical protein [Xylophilus sp.]KAF1048552.1 MAG: hypothetical protein GAK38_01303 [Xylophilus sp.]